MKSLSKIQYTKLVQISLTQSSYLQLVSETSQLDVHQDSLQSMWTKKRQVGMLEKMKLSRKWEEGRARGWEKSEIWCLEGSAPETAAVKLLFFLLTPWLTLVYIQVYMSSPEIRSKSSKFESTPVSASYRWSSVILRGLLTQNCVHPQGWELFKAMVEKHVQSLLGCFLILCLSGSLDSVLMFPFIVTHRVMGRETMDYSHLAYFDLLGSSESLKSQLLTVIQQSLSKSYGLSLVVLAKTAVTVGSQDHKRVWEMITCLE